MNTFAAIDLSLLPVPQIVEHDRLRADTGRAQGVYGQPAAAGAAGRDCGVARAGVGAADQTAAGERLPQTLWRQRVNEAAVANMLSQATDNDLDNLAANFNVKRLVTQEGNPNASPPLARMMESNARKWPGKA